MDLKFIFLPCLILLGMVALSEGFLPTAFATSFSDSSGRIWNREIMKSMLSLMHGAKSPSLPCPEHQDIYTDIILACHEGSSALN